MRKRYWDKPRPLVGKGMRMLMVVEDEGHKALVIRRPLRVFSEETREAVVRVLVRVDALDAIELPNEDLGIFGHIWNFLNVVGMLMH